MKPTDRLSDDLRPVLLGLFGEVGSIMATAKKLHREGAAFTGYHTATIEEFGDALWYFTALCRRLKIEPDTVFSKAVTSGTYEAALIVGTTSEWPVAIANRPVNLPEIDTALLKLGEATAGLLPSDSRDVPPESALVSFADRYLQGLHAAGLAFGDVISFNIHKTEGRFLKPQLSALPTFDSAFEEEERIPACFEIEMTQRKSGKAYLRWNGVFIGDPLTDNILDPDGYRFHDVFHFAHAAVLHWSPTFRALIRHKRKSNPVIDEAQDGGRAIVVEEGLTAWIFSRAKELGFFEQTRAIPFDVLKTIQQFTAGYEVEECPASLWEDAILQGYDVFRQMRYNGGGTVVGDRHARRITYKALEKN